MSTPPSQPGEGKAQDPIYDQIDELLAKIEAGEPITLNETDLPTWFNKKEPSEEIVAYDAEIEALLNGLPAESEPASPEPVEPATATQETPEQAEMLAALNSALQGLNEDTPADPPAEAASTASPPAEESLSMEDKLQQEIAALMNTETQVAPAPDSEPAQDDPAIDAIEGSFEAPQIQAATQTPQTSAANDADQIAMEIEGLLENGADEPVDPAADEAAINELDKMLAQEIDSDDELMGEFQSVEDLTAGIQVDGPAEATHDDEHAATARDVAAELDSQPENVLPTTKPEPVMAGGEPDEDPFAVLSQIADTVEKNEEEHHRRIKMQMPNWKRWLKTSKALSLNICFAMNWPARRFLNNEWRATLGLVSLMVAGTSSLFLIGVLIFG